MRTIRPFDYETDPSKLFIRVQLADQVGGTMENTFEVQLIDMEENKVPENLIAGKDLSIMEKSPAGTFVGEFSAMDQDGDFLIYSLVSGSGSEDKYFSLEQNGTLKSEQSLDRSGQSLDRSIDGQKVSIRVRVTYSKGCFCGLNQSATNI